MASTASLLIQVFFCWIVNIWGQGWIYLVLSPMLMRCVLDLRAVNSVKAFSIFLRPQKLMVQRKGPVSVPRSAMKKTIRRDRPKKPTSKRPTKKGRHPKSRQYKKADTRKGRHTKRPTHEKADTRKGRHTKRPTN
jgi:hypothetical protein